MDKKFFNIFFATIIFACAFFVPGMSQAYGNGMLQCFGFNDCKKNNTTCSTKSLPCDDNEKGQIAICVPTSMQCGALDACPSTGR